MQEASFHKLLLLLIVPIIIIICTSDLATAKLLKSGGQQQLKDVRKLQAGVWLQFARKHSGSNSAAADDAACIKDYSQPYLDRWRALQGTYCNASTSDAVSSSSSHVQCYAHPEADLSTCMVQNLFLSSTIAFLGDTPHTSELPQPAPGSIRLACNRSSTPSQFLRGRLQTNEGSRAWLVTAPSFGSPSTQLQRSCSSQQAVPHPVLFLLRVDPENSFHNLETVISVFSTLAVLKLEPGLLRYGLEVVIADERQAGYFLHIWRRLSWPHPLRILRQQPFPDGTCFSRAIIAPYTAHAQSLLTYKAGSVDEVLCESVVLQATSRWLRHLFRDLVPPAHRQRGAHAASGPETPRDDPGQQAAETSAIDAGRGSSSGSSVARMQFGGGGAGPFWDLAPLIKPSPTQSAAPLEELYVVWLSRRRFEQQRAGKLTSWQKARALPEQQQEELVVGLQRAVLQWNAKSCVTEGQENCQARSIMFSLRVAELSEMSFYPDQLSLMMHTGVLVGVHGAGLANQVYMQPRTGAVVEVWYGMESNTHYHNMAHMLGHAYFNVKAEEGQLEVAQVVAKVTAGMDEAATRHAATTAAAGRLNRKAWWWHKLHADGG